MILNLKKINTERGSLLLELLIVISLIAIILASSTNAIFLSLTSNRVSGQRDAAGTLASESIEAMKSISDENWQNIYSTTKTTAHYFPLLVNGKWTIASGDEVINFNNTIFTRFVTIENVSRNTTTRDIQSTYVSANDDPSTQKVTAYVAWAGADPVSMVGYLFRWKNIVCSQEDWVAAGSGDNVSLCTGTNYNTKDASIDILNGSLKLK